MPEKPPFEKPPDKKRASKKEKETEPSVDPAKEEQARILARQIQELRAKPDKTTQDWEQIAKKAKEIAKLFSPEEEKEEEKEWFEPILAKEQKAHENFFGQEFDLTSFRETLERYGPEKIEKWRELGLEPHFLPEVTMSQEATFPGWKLKPKDWYYQQVSQGKVLRQQPDGSLKPVQEAKLEGITVLIDTRLKPQYNEGQQMFENDNLLGPIITRLREQGKIERYDSGPQSSRFGVSANEWEEQVKPELAKPLRLEAAQLRFEQAIEANVIPQLYPDMPRKDDGQTNTWVWYEEYLDDRAYRLNGGHSDDGGLADVHYDSSANHWYYRTVRPLAVL